MPDPAYQLHAKDDLPIIPFETPAELEKWLEINHQTASGVWLKLAKKSSKIPSIDWPEVVEAALCFGWIDGQRVGYDEVWFLQRLTPRRSRSIWSKINTEKVAALVAAGRMRPAGQAAVDLAKADGRWDAAYAAQGKREVPPDLRGFLDAHAEAAAFWKSLNSTNQYAIIFRLHTAKKPETRAKRFTEFTRMLAAGEKIYP